MNDRGNLTYLLRLRDSSDEYLAGEYTYRAHLPADMPAANYWSVVLYDADTRVLLENGEPSPSVASNQQMTFNSDGSADIYFGPEPPNDPNANWIRTVPGRGYFAGLRLYSPIQAFFDQSWRPDDIEKVGE